jgi:hypothetical protein
VLTQRRWCLGWRAATPQLGANLQAVASLLRASRAVQQAVLDACSGPGNNQLQLCLRGVPTWSPSCVPITDLQLLQHFSFQVKWLRKYGRLVQYMALSASTRLHGADEALMCVAVRPPVQLQGLSLGAIASLANPAAVLQQLDASHLTQLTVSIADAHAAALLQSALPQLQSLRSLRVHIHDSFAIRHAPKDACLGALAPLTQLTELSLAMPSAGSAGLLVHLPSSLVSITLFTEAAADDDVRAIAQARQLQQLELNGVQGVAAAAPSSLTALTSLLHLSLAYLDVPDQADDEMIKQHAAVWSTLPVLHRLKVRRCRFSPGTAAAIAAATSVTSLWLECSADIQADLSATLAPLKQLRRLDMYIHGRSNADHQPVAASMLDSSVLADSVEQLVWCRWPLSPVARTQLITRTQLRKLVLDSSSIGDEELEVIAHYMQRLQLLGLARNSKISDAGIYKALGNHNALMQLLLAENNRRVEFDVLASGDAAEITRNANSPLVWKAVPRFSSTSVQAYLLFAIM